MIAAWWAVAAAAHPIGNRYVGHQLEVSIGQESLELAYAVEVPDQLGSARDAKASAALARELTSGLVIVADGRALPVDRTALEVKRGSEHTTRVELTLRAPLHATVHQLVISNGNLPEIPAYYAVRVQVDPRWTVLTPDAPTSEWSRDEAQRRVRLTLSHREDLLARWWELAGPTLPARVPLARAGAVPALDPLYLPRGTPETALVAVVCAGLLGLAGRRPAVPGILVALTCAALGGALLDPPLRAMAGALGAVATAVTVAIAPEWTASTALLAVVAAQPTGLAVTAATLAASGTLFARPGTQRLGVAGGCIAAIILLARATSLS